MTETKFNINTNEYLPLRDVVFNTLRDAILTGKREDGYHLLETIMQTVALYDGIYMKYQEKTVIKQKTKLPRQPTEASNLAWKAANMIRESFGIE